MEFYMYGIIGLILLIVVPIIYLLVSKPKIVTTVTRTTYSINGRNNIPGFKRPVSKKRKRLY